MRSRPGSTSFFFFLFIQYSYATYGDHDEDMYSSVPIRCPRSGGTLLAPLCPPPRPVPRRRDTHLRKYDKGSDKGKGDQETHRGAAKGQAGYRH